MYLGGFSLFNKIKQIFCEHDYSIVNVQENISYVTGEGLNTYSTILFCPCCTKELKIDSDSADIILKKQEILRNHSKKSDI